MARDGDGDERDGDGHDLEAMQSMTRIVLRPFGSPLPLGFFAFGAGVLLTALEELGAFGPGEARPIAVIGLCFCLPLELLAAVIAFVARDGAGGTILGVFATSWAVLGVETLVRPPPATSPTLGAFYLFLALVCVLIAVAAMSAKPFFGVILIVAAARFALVGLYQLADVQAVRLAAGVVGLALTAVALYGGEALLVEDTQQRTVLPLFRRLRARRAIEGSLREQIDRVGREAGVRQQL